MRMTAGRFALALVFTACAITALPAAGQSSQEPPSPLEPNDYTIGAPILDEWTATQRTYETGTPGLMITEVYPARVNFQDGGQWTEVDTTLVSGGDLDLQTAANSLEVALGDSAADPALAAVQLRTGEAVEFGMDDAESAPVQADGSVATYEDVQPGVDLLLESIPAGIKETIILHSAESPGVYRFSLEATGLTPDLEDGAVVFRDASGEARLTIPAGFMIDSSEPAAYSDGVEYRLLDGGATLEVVLDDEWLSDPARQYPVEVDPSLVVTAGTDDTYVNAGNSGNYSTLGYLRVGKGTYANRAFLHFDTAALTGMNVHSATLDLWQADSGSCTASPMDIYPVAEDWQGSTTTSWPGPDIHDDYLAGTITSGVGFSGSCPDALVSTDVTQLVYDWAGGNVANYGLSLRARDEALASQFKEFQSAQASNAPSVTVTWSDPTLSSVPLRPSDMAPEGWTQSSAPGLSATYSDPQADQGKITFLVYEAATGRHIGSLNSSTVNSGTSVNATLSSLGIDSPIFYRAVAVDMINGRYSRLSRDVTLVRPSNWISSPLPDDSITTGTDFTAQLASGVTATAVNFYVDGALEASDSSPPYEAADRMA
ncbi:MAG: DNRLRE domain-containing protein, partial [Chloroflexota bacterium]